MEPFRQMTGLAAPLAVANIDTDQIIPSRFLRRGRPGDFGKYLFHDWRFDADGSELPDFVLNRPQFRDARVLIAGESFAIGSSREHAVYALHDWGIRAVIAPSFNDIFRGNAFKYGLLLVTLGDAEVASLLREVADGAEVAIDLEALTVKAPSGKVHNFEIDPFQRECLLGGMDVIEFTLAQEAAIHAFEKRREAAQN